MARRTESGVAAGPRARRCARTSSSSSSPAAAPQLERAAPRRVGVPVRAVGWRTGISLAALAGAVREARREDLPCSTPMMPTRSSLAGVAGTAHRIALRRHPPGGFSPPSPQLWRQRRPHHRHQRGGSECPGRGRDSARAHRPGALGHRSGTVRRTRGGEIRRPSSDFRSTVPSPWRLARWLGTRITRP